MTPQEYLAQRAQAAGYNPQWLAGLMQYESGMNPYRWGGKGGNYYGLIQFGPNERQTYGITPQSSFNDQVDASIKFLQDRGYKPGMGLLDMYSTVNAGSPGHYNASDGNGTVSSHVANIQAALPKAQAWLGSTAPVQTAASTDGNPEQKLQSQYPLPAVDSASTPLSGQLAQMQANASPTQGAQSPGFNIAGLLGLAAKAMQSGQQPAPQPVQHDNQFNQQAQNFFQQALAQNQPRPTGGLLGWS